MATIQQRLIKAQGDLQEFKHLMMLRQTSSGFAVGYEPAPHLDYLDRQLHYAAAHVESKGTNPNGISRLVVQMPPRHGKTMTVAEMFAAWFLGRNPTKNIMVMSYNADLAERTSAHVMSLITHPMYQQIFPYVQLSERQKSKVEWALTAGGGLISSGTDARVMGKGAHVILVDDPFKGRSYAERKGERDRVWTAFSVDLMSRLEPYGIVVVIHQRWHRDDLIGRLLSREPERWTNIIFPALCENPDTELERYLGRKRGDALWQSRMSKAHLLELRERMGEYEFMSLYQQQPLAGDGLLFDIDRIATINHRDLPTMRQKVRFWDLALTDGRQSDWTVGLLLGIDADENLYILDIERFQARSTKVEEKIIQTAKEDKREVDIMLEGEKSGLLQLDYLLREPELRGFHLDKQTPIGSKVVRARSIASRIKHEKVYIAEGRWNEPFLDEMATFPNGAHDDQVDALSGAYEALTFMPANLASKFIMM